LIEPSPLWRGADSGDPLRAERRGRPPGGAAGARPRDLHHVCAPFLPAAGASPRTVMKTLGHSHIGLTMNTCTHVLPEIEREAIDAAVRAIFG